MVAVLSRGRGVPRGSYIDPKNDFSVVPPADWRVLVPGRLPEAAALNPALKRSAADSQIALVLIGPGVVGQGASSIHIDVAPGDLPALDRRDPEQVAGPIEAGIAANFGSFTRETVRLRNVDGLAAAELSGVLIAKPGHERLRLIQTVIRGYRRHYLVTFLGALALEARDRPAYDEVLSSFRVLRRPSVF